MVEELFGDDFLGIIYLTKKCQYPSVFSTMADVGDTGVSKGWTLPSKSLEPMRGDTDEDGELTQGVRGSTCIHSALPKIARDRPVPGMESECQAHHHSLSLILTSWRCIVQCLQQPQKCRPL